MIRYQYGLKEPRADAVKMLYRSYRTPAPVDLSDTLNRAHVIAQWHMLGNDEVGNCFWAGRAHELYLRSALKGDRIHVSTWDTYDDYSLCTGFQYGKPATDQGTDLQAGAAFCQKVGIRDVAAVRHKDAAYVAIQAGNLAEACSVVEEFKVCGLGILIGDNQQDQFTNRQPWDGPPGPNPGYHYVPLIDWSEGDLVVVTWGRLQLMTPTFFENQCVQGLAYLAQDDLTPRMIDDLHQLQKGSST